MYIYIWIQRRDTILYIKQVNLYLHSICTAYLDTKYINVLYIYTSKWLCREDHKRPHLQRSDPPSGFAYSIHVYLLEWMLVMIKTTSPITPILPKYAESACISESFNYHTRLAVISFQKDDPPLNHQVLFSSHWDTERCPSVCSICSLEGWRGFSDYASPKDKS